jgi:predicted glycosyltransferase
VRILVHAQHLSGVGHHVRSLEIARGLAQTHDVFFVDGGRPVPRPRANQEPERIPLPQLVRRGGGLATVDRARRVSDVLAERCESLCRAARRLAPDVFLIEHYPFSKWELEGELAVAIDAARAANSRLRVVCSVRDVCRRTRHEPTDDEAWGERVVRVLNADFDAVLVHADPRFTRLEDHFASAGRIEIPVLYTGFVSQQPDPAAARRDAGFAVLSTGGGVGSDGLARQCVESWKRLHAAGVSRSRALVVFSGLFWSASEQARIRRETEGGPFEVRPFEPDFISWMAAADLSISRAGYNTCTNVLATGCRALLIPDPRMSDQPFRARRLAELGLVDVFSPAAPGVTDLTHAIATALRRPLRSHDLDLDGAGCTRRLLESLSPRRARTRASA